MVPAAVVDRAIDRSAPSRLPATPSSTAATPTITTTLPGPTRLPRRGLHYLDCGISGGVFGLERGYCLMIGGEVEQVGRLEPILRSLAPGVPAAARRPRAAVPARHRRGGLPPLRPSRGRSFRQDGANGIEYGMMAAYAEGFNILHHANAGKARRAVDAETTPIRHPEHYQYDFNIGRLPKCGGGGAWCRRGSSTSRPVAFATDPALAKFGGTSLRLGRRPVDAWRQPLTRRYRPTSWPPPCSAIRIPGRSRIPEQAASAMRLAFGGHVERGHQS